MANTLEVTDLMAELSAYANQNTNLRNDLVLCGMARDDAYELLRRFIRSYEGQDATNFTDEMRDVYAEAVVYLPPSRS